MEPIWPLPRRAGGPSDDEIRRKFAEFDQWHYAYEFEGGLSFSAQHNRPSPDADAPERPLQRYRHFMPYLLEAAGGSLEGKRVLDIACNSGFWSIQCALLGADVTGFDARPELIEQANLLKSVVGVDNASFQTLGFWDMSPEALGGTFDIVLNLGILYHLPNSLEVLRLTQSMARSAILLDTAIYNSNECAIHLSWEESDDIRYANESGIVAFPSKSSVALMLRFLDIEDWIEIPMRTKDMPRNYLENGRASWLIKL